MNYLRIVLFERRPVIMTSKFLIADLKISVTSDYDKNLELSHGPYKFDFEGKPDVEFVVLKSDDLIENKYSEVTKLCPGKYYSKSENCDVLIDYDEKSGTILATTVFSCDYSRVEITKYDVKKLYDISDECFVVNLIDSAMHYVIRKFGGIVFHSSAISFNGEGVVFSAESGTGKSTHTSLWQKEFEGVHIINDDTPIIRAFPDGKVMLYGTPWAGSTGINSNEAVPLRAIVFLSRGETNSIEKTNFFAVMQKFFDAMVSPLSNEMFSDVADTLSEICKNVPIYNLSCNMNHDAAHVAKKQIFKD